MGVKPCKHITWPACRCPPATLGTPGLCTMLDAWKANLPPAALAPERFIYRVVPLHTGEPALGRAWPEVLGYNLAIVGLTRLGGG